MQGDARASVRVDPRSRALRRCSMPRRELVLRLERSLRFILVGHCPSRGRLQEQERPVCRAAGGTPEQQPRRGYAMILFLQSSGMVLW